MIHIISVFLICLAWSWLGFHFYLVLSFHSSELEAYYLKHFKIKFKKDNDDVDDLSNVGKGILKK